MDNVISLGGQRAKREAPDADFVKHDDFGREMTRAWSGRSLKKLPEDVPAIRHPPQDGRGREADADQEAEDGAPDLREGDGVRDLLDHRRHVRHLIG